ncbi:hypothetical protein FACS189446_4750 [Bacteroidia bacterium]|nr:hypothetical protein FACS189446_4750 [Bacteroidia bacterium]
MDLHHQVNCHARHTIKEAEITLSADGEKVGSFERKAYNRWELKYSAEPGIRYSILVKLPDGGELSASTFMPEKNIIGAGIEADKYPVRNFLQFTDGYPCWVFVLSMTRQPADLINPIPSASALLALLLGTDHPLVDRFNEDGNMHDLVPQATVPAYSYYVRVKPESVISEAGIPFCLQTSFGLSDFVYFRTASEEYDKYMKTSLQKMFVYRDEDDPGQWFDERGIYSNITGGLGIFAAYNDQIFYYYGDF